MTDEKRHPWAVALGAVGALVVIIATIASPIYYTGEINAQQQQGQTELRHALDNLSGQVSELTKAVGQSAVSNAALTRQLQDMDRDFNRRLEILEKDRTIESWKRQK